jgi:hypothetical protein
MPKIPETASILVTPSAKRIGANQPVKVQLFVPDYANATYLSTKKPVETIL